MCDDTKKSRLSHGTNSILLSNNKQNSTPTAHDNQEHHWEHISLRGFFLANYSKN